MFNLCTIVLFVSFVFVVGKQTINNHTNSNYKISTILTLKNGTRFICPYETTIYLTENDTVTVEMTHSRHINYALVTVPSKGGTDIIIGPNAYKKIHNYTVSQKQSGKWTTFTLTDKDASNVTTAPNTKTITYNGSRYYSYQCEYNVTVSSPENKSGDTTLMFILIGVGVLALIIVIQTFVIFYILKAKKVRRIEQIALSNRPRGSDTARYSSTPSQKRLLKAESTEEIYETLDVLQTAAEAPPPPPIETLPRPAKAAKIDKTPLLPGYPNQQSPKTPVPYEEERMRLRPAMPVPTENEGTNIVQNHPVNKSETEALTRTESNFSVHMRPTGKVKIPAFCAPPPATAVPRENVKTMRKQSTVNQGAITNELNDILKKRAGTMGGPEAKQKKPAPVAQVLKPPPPHKPKSVTPVLPQSAVPRPPLPTQKNPPPITKTPNCAHPLQHPALPPLPTQAQRAIPTPAHPISQQISPPHISPGFKKPLPAPPIVEPEMAEYTEMPEYAEYNEHDEDSDEWTYEPLDPPSKYDYNIYNNG